LEESDMTNDRLKEVEHNAACIYSDVYQWDFFEKQMKPAKINRFLNTPSKISLCAVLVAVTILIVYRLAAG
jgi:hypothetical protein